MDSMEATDGGADAVSWHAAHQPDVGFAVKPKFAVTEDPPLAEPLRAVQASDPVPSLGAAVPAGTGQNSDAEAKRWERTRSHPLYPQLVQTIAENSMEGLPPTVAAQRQPRLMAAPLPEQYDSADMTESVDFFVKDKIKHIAENTEAQRKARAKLESVGKKLLASLEEPVEQRLQTLSAGAAGGGAAAAPKRSQEEMKQLFMAASAKIQQERKQRGKKKKARAE